MKWISIKDKLPSDFAAEDNNECGHDYVLVYSQSRNLFGVAQLYDNRWIIFHDEGFSGCDINLELESNDISHWCKIEYPKGIYDKPDQALDL